MLNKLRLVQKDLQQSSYMKTLSQDLGVLLLINDKGTHFINQTIETLMKEYIMDHHKSSSYHP